MLAKINYIPAHIFIIALALLFSGCTPAGPRALLKGKKYLDQGDLADAITQLKRASALLPANANAWNYLGVALQESGQTDDAVNAYNNAVRCDHELAEAHLNLGMALLDQNKIDAAKTELIAYTLRRPNDASAWLKLGFAQLREGSDPLPAERSFSEVLALRPNDAEAYNGLGLARLQAGKARDAMRFFAAAVHYQPDFASALQNLATVNLEYLHDTPTALADLHAYLALIPRPANYNDVRDLVASLERNEVAQTVPPPQVPQRPVIPAIDTRQRPPATVQTPSHQPQTARQESEPVSTSRPQRIAAVTPQAPPQEIASAPAQTVQVPPEPEIVTTPQRSSRSTSNPASGNTFAQQQPLETTVPDDQPKSGFWHRAFSSNKDKTSDTSGGIGVTPLPGTTEEVPDSKPREPEPEQQPFPQPITSFNRYHYKSPSTPSAGDRRSAYGAFTKAQAAEQDENWSEAERWYQSAADIDPSWFQAQYNCAIIAQRAGNYSVALPHYEMALAIQPDSVDTRLNFARALRAMGYALDAAAELNKILAAHPDEVRAHFELANLYSQTIHDVPKARQHYLRVLALQPNNPHATEIRFWLTANPK